MTLRVQHANGGADLSPACAWATVSVTWDHHALALSGVVRADALKEATP
jgi:hypothetical protein